MPTPDMSETEIADLPTVVGGRYRVDKLLGRGGMAVVVAARDLVTDRDVALERLARSPDAHNYRRHLELFEREFHMLSQLAPASCGRTTSAWTQTVRSAWTSSPTDGWSAPTATPRTRTCIRPTSASQPHGR